MFYKIIIITLFILLSNLSVFSNNNKADKRVRKRYHLKYSDYISIADKLVSAMTKARWFKIAVKKKIKLLILEKMKNYSDEHINTSIITNIITKKLKENGLKSYQLKNQKLLNRTAKLSSARLLLRGKINSIRRVQEKKSMRIVKKLYIFKFIVVDIFSSSLMDMFQFEVMKIKIDRPFKE